MANVDRVKCMRPLGTSSCKFKTGIEGKFNDQTYEVRFVRRYDFALQRSDCELADRRHCCNGAEERSVARSSGTGVRCTEGESCGAASGTGDANERG